MKYNEETYQVIKSRILSSMTNEIDKREGSFVNDMISPLSAEIAKNYIQLDALIDTFFLDNLEREELEKRAGDFGIIRKEAQYANGFIKILGQDGSLIDNNMVISTDDNLEYQIVIDDEDGCITIENGYAYVYVVAKVPGTVYNIPANTNLYINPDITYINYCINEKDFRGGIDEETDEDLLNRLKDFLANPVTSGNEAYYRQKALEIPGINKVILVPRWDGPGTLKLIVFNDSDPVDKETLEDVKTYIEECRVVDANITVVTPTIINLNISCNVEIDNNYTIEETINVFKSNLDDYLDKCKDKVIYHKVVSCLSSIDAVLDFSDFILNDGMVNVPFNDETRPAIGTIKINGYEG